LEFALKTKRRVSVIASSRLTALVFIGIWIGLFGEIIFDSSLLAHLRHFLEQHRLLAPLTLLFAQVALASLLLPCSPLTVLAGLLWGFYLGLVYSIVATVVASLWTFLLGRRVLRAWLLRGRLNAWQLKVLATIDRYGWKAAMVAHANPVFPGSSLGYAFGASSVSVGSFALGALLGTLPLQLLMVGIGHLTEKMLVDHLSAAGLVSIGTLAALVLIYKRFAPAFFEARNATFDSRQRSSFTASGDSGPET
jgi:uncharacterized membrane protein YdjX (TVP38/TMEM64 family)